MTTPPPSPSYYRPDVPRRDEVALAKPTADSEGLRANRRRLTLTLDEQDDLSRAFDRTAFDDEGHPAKLVSVGRHRTGAQYDLVLRDSRTLGRTALDAESDRKKLDLGIPSSEISVSRRQCAVTFMPGGVFLVCGLALNSTTGIFLASDGRRKVVRCGGTEFIGPGDIVILDANAEHSSPHEYQYAYKVLAPDPTPALGAAATVAEPLAAVATVPAPPQGDPAPVAPQGNGPASPAAPPIMPMEPDVAAPAPDAVPAPMAAVPTAPDRHEAPPPIVPRATRPRTRSLRRGEGGRGPVYTEEVYAAVQLEGTTYGERVADLWRVLKQNSRRRG